MSDGRKRIAHLMQVLAGYIEMDSEAQFVNSETKISGLLSGFPNEEEAAGLERSLRPARCEELVGQREVMEQLQLAIEAADKEP